MAQFWSKDTLNNLIKDPGERTFQHSGGSILASRLTPQATFCYCSAQLSQKSSSKFVSKPQRLENCSQMKLIWEPRTSSLKMA